MDAVSAESDESVVDVGAAKRRIRERGVRICEAEQERAIRRPRERGELSDDEEAAIRGLAERLTEALLSVSESHLDAVSDGGAATETARLVLELFGED
jgi:U3 small nucleolar ribonucleoprotein component